MTNEHLYTNLIPVLKTYKQRAIDDLHSFRQHPVTRRKLDQSAFSKTITKLKSEIATLDTLIKVYKKAIRLTKVTGETVLWDDDRQLWYFASKPTTMPVVCKLV